MRLVSSSILDFNVYDFRAMPVKLMILFLKTKVSDILYRKHAMIMTCSCLVRWVPPAASCDESYDMLFSVCWCMA